MRRRICSFVVVLAVTTLFPSAPARAQRGQLIEDLFRSIADAQLEREQRQRSEAERLSRPPAIAPPGSVQQVPIARPGQFPPGVGTNSRPGSINVRSREAAEFAQNLVGFDGAISSLVDELRRNASQNAAARALLPEAYQLAAGSRALIQRCDGLASLDQVVQPCSELDIRWRQLSFRLRSLDGLSEQCANAIRSCDQMLVKMSRQLQIQPQFDRHQLHDVMLIAATYMQALMDDLQLARVPTPDVERLTHDCRLLRQNLLAEADRVDQATYEDVVTRFTEFVSRWSVFSEQVYAINDPHLQRRLDRIRETGDQTYALLWIPPPYSASTLAAAAQRLERRCADLLDQLTIRSLVALSSQQRTRVLETSNRMYQASRDLVHETTRGAARVDRQRNFERIVSDWTYLRPIFYQIASLNRATLDGIDQECELLRNAYGISLAGEQPIAREELIQVAAALEGWSEYLHADLQRYERYLQPESYRASIVEASGEFYHHARQLHVELSRRADLKTLQREAEHMLDGWEQLSKDLSHIGSHGLTERRAQSLQQSQQELVPQVARIAAALVER